MLDRQCQLPIQLGLFTISSTQSRSKITVRYGLAAFPAA
jgi:hypothetical protein